MTAPSRRPGGQRKPIAHGFYRGAKQHRRRGEKPCPKCAAAEAAYQRELHPPTYISEEQWQARVAHRESMKGTSR